MPPNDYVLDLPGGMTERGYWLYVWRVEVDGTEQLYVGRTGDNSSPYAASVYRRMGQHLGDAKNTNALLKHLRIYDEDTFKRAARPIHEYQGFKMVSYGPIFPEVERHADFKHGDPLYWQTAFDAHKPFRDRAAALECKLARELKNCGYSVMNKVIANAALQKEDWLPVRDAFAKHFEKLKDRP